jgi:tripartite-type tricarboxylate transporter receptor subunit TctC
MGLFAPKGLPAAISERLSKELQTVMARPDVQQQILALSAEPAYLPPAQFADFIAIESRRWSAVIAGLPKSNP